MYEELGLGTEEKLGVEVVRTQWLDFSTLGSRSLLGRRVLIVVRADLVADLICQDEVDDSRTTLAFAVSELRKDIVAQLASLPAERRAAFPPTELAVFVCHNKVRCSRPTRADVCRTRRSERACPRTSAVCCKQPWRR